MSIIRPFNVQFLFMVQLRPVALTTHDDQRASRFDQLDAALHVSLARRPKLPKHLTLAYKIVRSIGLDAGACQKDLNGSDFTSNRLAA